MATYVPAKKNTAYIFYAALVSQANTKINQSTPTIASGDFKVSIDGAALANLSTLPTNTPAGSDMVKFSLSSSEMNGDNITVQCIDAAGAEWCSATFNIQTSARQVDDLAYPATSGRSMVVDSAGLVDANAVKIGPTGSGTAQTARDIGLSVLLASTYDFAKGTVAMTESYASLHAAPTPAQALFEILQYLLERSVSSTTETVKKIDGSTSAFTSTLDSATAPTSRTRAT